MTTYYIKSKGTAFCDSSRNQVGSDNANQTGVSKASPFIYAVGIGQNSRDPVAGQCTLRWRISGGAFAALGATGAMKYTTATVLSNGTALTEANHKVEVTGMTWQNGEEVEDGAAASIDLGSDYYSELQFAVDPADAENDATYEFELYDNTRGQSVAIETGSYLTVTIAPADLSRSISDGLGFSDAGATSVKAQVGDLNQPSIYDAIALSDSVSFVLDVSISVSDTLSLLEEVSADIPVTVSVSDDLALSESVSAAVDRNISVSETLYISDLGAIDRFIYQQTDVTVPMYSGSTIADYQSFTGDGRRLKGVIFVLSRTGDPPGNCEARLYAHTGVFGISSKPTGSPLATSDPVLASTIDAHPSKCLVTFTFPTPYLLGDGTKYCLVVTYNAGNSTNRVNAWLKLNSEEYGHPGNFGYSVNLTSWTNDGTRDLGFYALTEPVTIGDVLPSLSDTIAFTEEITHETIVSPVDLSVQELLAISDAPTAEVTGLSASVSEDLFIQDSGLRQVAKQTYGTGENYPHAMIFLNGYIYLALFTSPGKILKIDSSDLANYAVITLDTGNNNFSDMVYSTSRQRLYALHSKAGVTRVYEIDPVAFDSATLVINDSGFSNSGMGALTTDETHLFVLSNSNQTYIIRYAMSGDPPWTAEDSQALGAAGGHAVRYDSEGPFLYATLASSPYAVFKIDPSDLSSYSSESLDEGVTDDIGISEDHLWLGLEIAEATVLKVAKSDLSITTTVIATESVGPCYGVWFDGTWVWALFAGDKSMVRINPTTNAVEETIHLDIVDPNEFAWDGNKFFITGFTEPLVLGRYLYNDFAQIGDLIAYAYEDVAITDSLSMLLEGDLSTSVSDDLIFEESVTAEKIGEEAPVDVSIFDALTFTEPDLTAEVSGALEASTADALVLLDSPTGEVTGDLSASTSEWIYFDDITMSAGAKAQIGDLLAEAADALAFGEGDLVPEIGDLETSVFDAISLGEAQVPAVEIIGDLLPSVSDDLVLTEDPAIEIPEPLLDLTVSIFDALTFTEPEDYPVQVGDLSQSIDDTVHFDEADVLGEIGDLNGSLYDELGVSETIEAQIGDLSTSIYDAIVFGENPVVLFGEDVFQSVTESLALADEVTAEITGDLSISLSDSLIVEEREGFDGYTKSLLHFNGEDGSPVFTDESGKVWTRVGTAQIDTAQSVFGEASGFFDGDSDTISTPYSSDFDMDTGNFTIDFWVRFNGTPGAQWYYFFSKNDLSNDWFIVAINSATHRLWLMVTVAGTEKSGANIAFTPAADTWYHIAVVRNGTSILMAVDGDFKTVSGAGVSGSLTLDTHVTAYIGSNGLQYWFDGWIDEFRISKGIARWTEDFTPYSQEYGTNISAEIGDLQGSTYDSIILSDTPTVTVGDLPITISDTLAFEENPYVAVAQDWVDVNVADTLAFSDQVTPEVSGDLFTAIADDLALGEEVSASIGDLLATTSDLLQLLDSPTGEVTGDLSTSIYDEITLDELPYIATTSDVELSVSENLVLTDTPTALVTGDLSTSVYDALALSDSPMAQVGDLSASGEDTLALEDAVAGRVVGDLDTTVYDTITFEEAPFINLEITASIADTLALAEQVVAEIIGDLSRTVFDQLTIEESTIQQVIGDHFMSLADDLHLSDEAAAQIIGALTRTVIDNLSLGEEVAAKVTGDLFRSIYDALGISETVTATIEGAIEITLQDAIGLGENVVIVTTLPLDIYPVLFDVLSFYESISTTVTGDLLSPLVESLSLSEKVTAQIVTPGKDASPFGFERFTTLKERIRGTFEPYDRFKDSTRFKK